ncbi:MAG: hypothetical protein U0T73_09385 [Chitinophagales bacterium]
MNRIFIFVWIVMSAVALRAQEVVKPSSIIYKSKQIMANGEIVRFKEDDSLIVVFRDGQIFSNMSEKFSLTHLTDTKSRIRYSNLDDKKLFKIERINPDTTFYDFTYVKLKDTLIWKNYVGYRHKFTMRDKFNGTTFTVVLYECPEIQIDPAYQKFYFSELFFMKVPIKLTGGVIKALAEMRVKDKPVSRGELLLLRFDDLRWPVPVDFKTPIEKNYTLVEPDTGKKDRERAKRLVEEISGRKDYPSTSFKEGFEHE